MNNKTVAISMVTNSLSILNVDVNKIFRTKELINACSNIDSNQKENTVLAGVAQWIERGLQTKGSPV